MLRLHAVMPRSRANGPGLRAVVWFQGCSLGCPGCFNPDTHPDRPRLELEVPALVEQLVAEPDLEGVTFSGGEPFQQPEALLALVQALRQRTRLSLLAFSGYSREEVERLPLGPAILGHLDVLVAGRYVQTLRVARDLKGSSNKQIHLLTPRYQAADLAGVVPAEVWIGPDGTVILSGMDPLVGKGK